MTEIDKDHSPELKEIKEKNWGEIPNDNFGYASDEERRGKRGLEDWEMVEKVPQSQKGVPKWFLAVIAAVLLVAIGLSFPFWGDRPGYEREWINWGFGAAILYLLVFGGFVYFMVNKYSPNVDGTEDMDLPERPVNNKNSQDAISTEDPLK
ncbi:hypothetical protein [Kaarinaea lacus]